MAAYRPVVTDVGEAKQEEEEKEGACERLRPSDELKADECGDDDMKDEEGPFEWEADPDLSW